MIVKKLARITLTMPGHSECSAVPPCWRDKPDSHPYRTPTVAWICPDPAEPVPDDMDTESCGSGPWWSCVDDRRIRTWDSFFGVWWMDLCITVQKWVINKMYLVFDPHNPWETNSENCTILTHSKQTGRRFALTQFKHVNFSCRKTLSRVNVKLTTQCTYPVPSSVRIRTAIWADNTRAVVLALTRAHLKTNILVKKYYYSEILTSQTFPHLFIIFFISYPVILPLLRYSDSFPDRSVWFGWIRKCISSRRPRILADVPVSGAQMRIGRRSFRRGRCWKSRWMFVKLFVFCFTIGYCCAEVVEWWRESLTSRSPILVCSISCTVRLVDLYHSICDLTLQWMVNQNKRDQIRPVNHSITALQQQ